PVVQSLHDPGVGAEAVLGLALWRLAPKELLNGAPAGHIGMSLAAAVAGVGLWMLLAPGLGAWKTGTRGARAPPVPGPCCTPARPGRLGSRGRRLSRFKA